MRKAAFYIHKYNRLISCKIRTGRLSGHTKAQYCKAADDDAAKNTRFLQVFKYNQYFCSAVIDSNALHRTIQPYDKNTAAYGTYNNKDRHKGLQIRRA